MERRGYHFLSATLLLAVMVGGCVRGVPATSPPPRPSASPAATKPGVVPSALVPLPPSGTGVISNNGASLTVTGLVTAPASVISNNGGTIISDHGGGYRLQSLVEVPVTGARVMLRDAAGNPVLAPDGQPLVTTTDATGRYGFAGELLPRNYVVGVALAGKKGELTAMVPKQAGPRVADANFVSTLTTRYILDQFVTSQQGTDPLATFDKLPPDVEAATRQKAGAAFAAGSTAVPDDLTPQAIVQTVNDLRRHDRGFDGQMETVRRLLTIGSTTASTTDGPALQAQLGGPLGTAVDAAGNVYIADSGNALIRKLSPAGTISTLAGSGLVGSADGQGTAASFNNPHGIAVDAAGNVFVADSDNRAIRMITPAGLVTTLAGGAGLTVVSG
ncbi:MAG: hypothetical protein JWM80_2329, partial [Cyanobacteria bacterium RYN_339]|nr:hypothetical protein [Cyanobacteria bacterium RYN_339]